MPSGYEKSPDYGGPKPGWPTAVMLVIAVAVIAMAFWAKLG